MPAAHVTSTKFCLGLVSMIFWKTAAVRHIRSWIYLPFMVTISENKQWNLTHCIGQSSVLNLFDQKWFYTKTPSTATKHLKLIHLLSLIRCFRVPQGILLISWNIYQPATCFNTIENVFVQSTGQIPVCLEAYALLGRLASWRSSKICLMFRSGNCKLHSYRNREHGYAGPVY